MGELGLKGRRGLTAHNLSLIAANDELIDIGTKPMPSGDLIAHYGPLNGPHLLVVRSGSRREGSGATK